MKIYIAGKVGKDSSFGTHHWRDSFCDKLTELSGIKLTNLDPLTAESDLTTPEEIFSKDCKLINEADIFVVYLSDDISVGGSQEILIARYLKKPVLGFAPYGGKFNGAKREMLGRVIQDYKDPFVYATCDVVCGSIEELAIALADVRSIRPSGLKIIDDGLRFQG